MDTTKENVIENTTNVKVNWTKRQRIDDNVDTNITINDEQQKVINELEEVLSFLKGFKILNDDALVNIRKPLDDLQSSLKYLPIESSFDALPKEIKTDILSYLCDLQSFKAASVCREWKMIVKHQFTHGHVFEDGDVKIGKHCSNYHECEDNWCFMPAEMLKASMTHKLDIPLIICHPLTEVDARVVTEGLLSVSNLTIKSECECKDEEDDDDDDDDGNPILSNNQLEDYFEGLSKRGGTMEKMELIQVDMTGINQDKLINCLLNKTKWLTLDEGEFGEMLNVETFIDILSQFQPKLKYLILHHFEYSDYYERYLAGDMADALCQVENVKLHLHFPLEIDTLKRLIENILTRPIRMKSLLIFRRMNFCKLMSPGELLTLMGRMELLVLWGSFTPEQLQAARILPDVEIDGEPPYVTLKKGRNEIF